MTNIYSSVASIYDDPKKRIILVTATDLESNLTFDKDVTVPKTMERSKLKSGQVPIKWRTNSKGNPVYLVEAETDDDILNTENALASKALRVCLLRLIPGDILDEAINEAQATLSKKIMDDPEPRPSRRCATTSSSSSASCRRSWPSTWATRWTGRRRSRRSPP